MTAYNVWLPSDKFFGYNDGVTTSLSYETTTGTNKMLCRNFVIPNFESGFGITFDQISPAFAMTKPPKVCYSSTTDLTLAIKDSAGWIWTAPMPKQNRALERGWSWLQFILGSVQDNTGPEPVSPAPGNVKAFQFSGAAGAHGPSGTDPVTVRIAYVSGRSPEATTQGTIRQVILTDKNPVAHTWKVGNMELVGGTRQEVKYIGALPFGLQMNGPRNRLSSLPYRGPIVAGYQSGTPWVNAGNNEALSGMLDFMLESQVQFKARHPQRIEGPFMHIYLQALWDCEQNGTINTWVWDGPDGNPAWDGWQYRAIDSMGRTWYEATRAFGISPENITKLNTVCSKFLDWLYYWLQDNPEANGVPNDWRPPGWAQGNPFPANGYLDPKYTGPAAHDDALALKGAMFATLAGYDQLKGRYIIHRLMSALLSLQYSGPDAMTGAFTQNPTGFEVYGFEQGEILEALALAKQHPDLLSSPTNQVS